MNTSTPIKVVASVSDTARLVGLSRSRFYQLIGTAFPHPSRDPESGRPFYDAAQQEVCVEVRRRNCSIDGRPILFYAGRAPQSVTPRRSTTRKPATSRRSSRFVEITEAVWGLGLATATESQVEQAVKELYPCGTDSRETGEIIRAVFVHLVSRTRSIGSGDK